MEPVGPGQGAGAQLGHLDTHCLCLGCLAALFPSVPCKYVHPGPRCPPHHAREVGGYRLPCGTQSFPSRPAVTPSLGGLWVAPGQSDRVQGGGEAIVLRVHGGGGSARWAGGQGGILHSKG